jgi:(1->4)-alpha-D-glucan 1-alpha-D-glucosylmutase
MQTLVGAWPITEDRLLRYVEKAAREAKAQTSWTDPAPGYEASLKQLATAVLEPGPIHDAVARWTADLEAAAAASDLAAKLIQLTLPGVPDVYQGCEAVSRSLVDPDNRRPVDYARRRDRLRMLDGGDPWRDLSDQKLHVTSYVLRLRRERPELFDESAEYRRLATGTEHALAFMRGADAVTVVSRWPRTLELRGGWADESLALPPGGWRDVLSERAHDGGDDVRFADLLADLPVALLASEAA